MSEYKPTIGIEIHLELKTNAKAFSPSTNNYNSSPNTNVNEIDFAYPGVLPTFNYGVLKKAIRACLGLNMNLTKIMHFDRKNYYYPDLPKGYQITQFDTPIGTCGYTDIIVSSGNKRIGISDIHIEEDTCKSLHYNGKTLLNYNRSGVPLIEIVSSPDMHTAEEAMAYAENIREIMYYLGVSDCKIEEGSMRCDVNISVSKDDNLGIRSEIKNIGSISNIGEAIEYEIKRQTDALENGIKLYEDTRKFDQETKTTIFMRKKEPNKDYRYFPEPDIPKVILDSEWIMSIKKTIPMLPNELKDKYRNLNINEIAIKSLIQNRELSIFLNELIDMNVNPVISANILTGDILSYLNKKYIKLSDTKITKENLSVLINKLDSNEISSKIAKEILPEIIENGTLVDTIISNKGLKQISDENSLRTLIIDILNNNEKAVLDYKNGLDRSIKFLMGQIMKETKGQANPVLANDILLKELENRK